MSSDDKMDGCAASTAGRPTFPPLAGFFMAAVTLAATARASRWRGMASLMVFSTTEVR
ncbi:MAG: hypothetical protein NVV74_07065 [Magnetospirillum sp.]|nr:hypothetical protein [Magnetospirillum sp.]